MSFPLAKTEDQIAGMESTGFTARATGFPRVRVYSGLEESPESFLNLFDKAGRQSLFLTLPWFQNFVQTATAPEDRARIYAAAGAHGSPAGVPVNFETIDRIVAFINSKTSRSA